MLAPGAELPAILGAEAPLENVADLESTGWELAVSWNDKIGDFVVTLPLFKAIKEQYPNTKITALVSPRLVTFAFKDI